MAKPELGWSNSHRVGGIEELRAIKAGVGPDLLIQGSSTIYPALMAAELLDQLTLMTFPVVLGSGKRIFSAETPAESMRMIDHKVTRSGAVIATYEPAGAVEHGWAGPQSTSTREEARQAAMADGSW
jgi:dihydrofolate reductase